MRVENPESSEGDIVKPSELLATDNCSSSSDSEDEENVDEANSDEELSEKEEVISL